MKSTKSILMSVAFLFLSSKSFGGREVGNGGLIVSCLDVNGRTVSTELLDFYESRFILRIPMRDDLRAVDTETLITKVIRELFRLDPERALRLSKWRTSFFSEAAFLDDVNLTSTDDFDAVALPIGCSLKQAAIQKEPLFPEEKRYYLSKLLWDTLSAQDRAGLVLHELAYREAIGAGQTDSRRTRLFIAFLTSRLIQEGGQADYDDRVSRISLPSRLPVDSPWLGLSDPFMWRITSDMISRRGESSIIVSTDNSLDYDQSLSFKGKIGRILGQSGSYVGFASAYAPVVAKNQLVQSAIPNPINAFSFDVCVNTEQQVTKGTFMIRPSAELLARLGVSASQDAEVTLQRTFDITPNGSNCEEVYMTMDQFELISRGKLLGAYNGDRILVEDIREIGFGIIRSNQGFNEDVTPAVLDFEFSIKNISPTSL
jgi:hypothetical protein